MPTISIVINADTRPEKSNAEAMFSGVCNTDFLTDGVRNKQKFFSGFDYETILFIDQHLKIDERTLDEISELVDVLVIRKHTNEPNFNDFNYLNALQLARGKYIAHFDQDSSAFSSSKESVQELIDLLEQFSYVSYPSHWSPGAVDDPSFGYMWASTRFFMCKRETLDLTELIKCQIDYNYCYEKYPASKKCHWLEHILGLHAKYNGNGVYYPRIELSKLAIFSWRTYEKWTLRRLNELPYSGIQNWLHSHPIQYPNDVDC